MPSKKSEDISNDAATLSSKAHTTLSQVLQDIRTTVSHLRVPLVSPLAVLDSTAVDALKDLYYIINNEDPHNVMPARKFVLEQRLVQTALLPLVNAVHADPASQSNQKRWGVPMYQSLRLLSVLSIPISEQHEFLKPGCNLDLHMLKLRTDFALNRPAMAAFVALLQYYIERKAEKQSSLANAEDSKLEDARIDNILRFFRNILSPPRNGVGTDIITRDRGVHLALVAALQEADLYSTLTIIFSSKEDAAAQYCDLVFLVADIYAQTFRHTSPQQLYQCYWANRRSDGVHKVEAKILEKTSGTSVKRASVFDETPETITSKPVAVVKDIVKPSRSYVQSSNLRAAIQRERTFVGGSRAVRKSARWTSRHSGRFATVRQPSVNETENGNQQSESYGGTGGNARTAASRIISARNAIKSKLSMSPDMKLQEHFKVNCDLLCLQVAKGRLTVMKKDSRKNTAAEIMRKDYQTDGLKGIVALTTELISDSFTPFLEELRSRIEETKVRTLGEDGDALRKAQRALLCILGSVVGFQREKFGKVFRTGGQDSAHSQIHENNMKSLLASDFKIVKKEWVSVQAGIEVETFRLVFRILVEACDSLKGKIKHEMQIEDIEVATFAVKEMMKMLQAMAAVPSGKSETEDNDQLGPRDIALNTIEQLFVEEAFLNAPADLAKDYSAKRFSFRHLSNIIEVTHAFTTILLDEKELSHLQVSKKIRKNKKGRMSKNHDAKPDSEVKEEDGDPVPPGERVNKKENDSNNDIKEDEIDEEEKQLAIEQQHSKEADEESNAPSDAKDQRRIDEGFILDDRRDNSDIIPHGAKADGNTDTIIEDDQKAAVTGNLKKEADKDAGSSDGDRSSDDEDTFEPEMREIESVGIIRRFANWKALQCMLLPIRAALCNASSLSGSIHNIPDGSGELLSPVVVAKSAHVIAAIWKVARIRERGALCGQFFNFATLHLMNLALEASKKKTFRESSVLASLAMFAKDATNVFFSWLKLNPGLVLDTFFVMEKQSCNAYVSSMRHRELLHREQNREEDSGNDSDLSDLVRERKGNRVLESDSDGDIEFENAERRAVERRERKSRKTKNHLRRNVAERRRDRRGVEEDEDVDDFDNLEIGKREDSSTDDSDDDGSDVEEPANKPKKKAQVKKSSGKGRAKQLRNKKGMKEGGDSSSNYEDGDSEAGLSKKKEQVEKSRSGLNDETPFCRLPASRRRPKKHSSENKSPTVSQHRSQKSRMLDEDASDLSDQFTDDDIPLARILQSAGKRKKSGKEKAKGRAGSSKRRQHSRKKQRLAISSRSSEEAIPGNEDETRKLTPKLQVRSQKGEETEPGTTERGSPIETPKADAGVKMLGIGNDDGSSMRELSAVKRRRIVTLSSDESD